jgi:hypothetical protein
MVWKIADISASASGVIVPAARAALITQLITLAAVIFGGWIAVQIFKPHGHQGATTVNIRKAIFKRNHFHG